MEGFTISIFFRQKLAIAIGPQKNGSNDFISNELASVAAQLKNFSARQLGLASRRIWGDVVETSQTVVAVFVSPIRCHQTLAVAKGAVSVLRGAIRGGPAQEPIEVSDKLSGRYLVLDDVFVIVADRKRLGSLQKFDVIFGRVISAQERPKTRLRRHLTDIHPVGLACA